MKRYGDNIREIALQPEKKQGIYICISIHLCIVLCKFYWNLLNSLKGPALTSYVDRQTDRQGELCFCGGKTEYTQNIQLNQILNLTINIKLNHKSHN